MAGDRANGRLPPRMLENTFRHVERVTQTPRQSPANWASDMPAEEILVLGHYYYTPYKVLPLGSSGHGSAPYQGSLSTAIRHLVEVKGRSIASSSRGWSRGRSDTANESALSRSRNRTRHWRPNITARGEAMFPGAKRRCKHRTNYFSPSQNTNTTQGGLRVGKHRA